MRTISKSRNHFHGTHRGYEIEIERERPPVESFGERHFYIRVFNGYGHAYDGYSPAGVTTLAEAKREALYGACLKERPPTSSEPDARVEHVGERSVHAEPLPTSTTMDEGGGKGNARKEALDELIGSTADYFDEPLHPHATDAPRVDR